MDLAGLVGFEVVLALELEPGKGVDAAAVESDAAPGPEGDMSACLLGALLSMQRPDGSD